MRIGIDFDRVLFKTDKFKEYLNEEVDGLKHVDASPYNEHGVYSPKIHAELCDIEEEDIYNAISGLEDFLYEDVYLLEESDHEIVIVTRGLSKFQKAKIEASGAHKYVDKIIIVEKGSKDVADIEFLIDDVEGEIEKADLPGFVLERGEDSLSDALKEAEDYAA